MKRVCECGAKEGQWHRFGCRFEQCPFCEGTLGSDCDCCYDLLGLRSSSNPPEYDGLPRDVYKGGLSAEQEARWQAILEARGRLPFVDAPQMCARCGRLWPDFFVVQDTVWEYYAGPRLRDAVVCEPCFDELRRAVDRHQPRPDWLSSEAEIAAYLRAWRSGDQETLRRLDPGKFEPGDRRPRRTRRRT
jgi:hypothetical protein